MKGGGEGSAAEWGAFVTGDELKFRVVLNPGAGWCARAGTGGVTVQKPQLIVHAVPTPGLAGQDQEWEQRAQ